MSIERVKDYFAKSIDEAVDFITPTKDKDKAESLRLIGLVGTVISVAVCLFALISLAAGSLTLGIAPLIIGILGTSILTDVFRIGDKISNPKWTGKLRESFSSFESKVLEASKDNWILRPWILSKII